MFQLIFSNFFEFFVFMIPEFQHFFDLKQAPLYVATDNIVRLKWCVRKGL